MEGTHEPIMLDLTPPGLKTPEGAERVSEAMNDFEHSGAEVANLLTQFFSTWKVELHALAERNPEMMDDLTDAETAIEDRHRKQDAFLSSLAGQLAHN